MRTLHKGHEHLPTILYQRAPNYLSNLVRQPRSISRVRDWIVLWGHLFERVSIALSWSVLSLSLCEQCDTCHKGCAATDCLWSDLQISVLQNRERSVVLLGNWESTYLTWLHAIFARCISPSSHLPSCPLLGAYRQHPFEEYQMGSLWLYI